MLKRCIAAEDQKLSHSHIWLACVLIPIIPAIMGTFNYLQNLGILKSQWYSLWAQLTLFYSNFFYAPLIALYCSWLWRMEHLNHNWNVFMTVPVPIRNLYFGKLAVILKVTLFTQIWLGILYFLCGKLAGLSGIFPLEILGWLLRGTLAAISVGALQLLLSMVIRSFSVPIGIALLGSIIGLLVSNRGLGVLWPYSMMLLGMNANKSEDMLSGNTLGFLLGNFLFFLLFTGIALFLLKKKDIKT